MSQAGEFALGPEGLSPGPVRVFLRPPQTKLASVKRFSRTLL